ncbi:multidrug efflux pump subunit AcrA (membrane-fusion protein) [Comamonas sp. BIGb0152]|uniref:HlyD family efflux transporter periplasmic adaptor subunit n=1 Tax=Comamonas sp. BIGb0152 TaxID=2940601 RepID=UPI002169D717|nr:HlyD family efflux transporter periplasmic adaptor subunit [Comamonas sp. BIGb0152]MCS4292430.1 multidrug efflux pump subunit AcrA (membrane-fusion protein) [Comamonas sp. BIGb0152]
MTKTSPTPLSSPHAWLALGLIGMAALGLVACTPAADSPPVNTATQQQNRSPVAVARGKIEVDGGLLNLASAIDGTVQKVAVREGQQVQAGQLLLKINDQDLRAELAVAQSAHQLAQAKHKAQAARLPALQTQLKRLQAAARDGAADMQEVDNAQTALRNAQSEADVAQAEVQLAQAKTQQLRDRQRLYQLSAPEAATVVHLHAQVGSQVHTNQATMRLLPQRPLRIRAELNESFAGAVQKGMRATVVLDNDSATPLPEARVLRINPMFGPSALQDDAQRGTLRVVECVLEFEAPPDNLRVGQNVRVSFHE